MGQIVTPIKSAKSARPTEAAASVEHESFQHQLGRRLKDLRKSQGLSQTDLAAQIDMTRVGVGYIEQGRRAPSLQTLEDLSRLYGLTVSQLVDVSESALPVTAPQ